MTTEFEWDQVIDAQSIHSHHKVRKEVRSMLKEQGIGKLYPMQKVVHEYILTTDIDVAVKSPTGSGKTLAFTLPLIDLLMPHLNHVQAVIFEPTFPLAKQVELVMKPLLQAAGLSVTCFGEVSLEAEVKKTSHVIVTTPMRLLGHLAYNEVDFGWLDYVVFDETDKLLTLPSLIPVLQLLRQQYRSPVFKCNLNDPEKCVYNPAGRVNSSFRSLLFSATLSSSPKSFKQLEMNKPILIDFVTSFDRRTDEDKKYIVPANIKHLYSIVPSEDKDMAILQVIKQSGRCIVFCNMNTTAYVLYKLVESMAEYLDIKPSSIGYMITTMSKKEKLQAISRAERGDISILITTDIMSRGIDIKNIQTVINYDIPSTVQLYVHRAGRTGRASANGCCHSIISDYELRNMDHITNKLQIKCVGIPVTITDDLRRRFETATEQLSLDQSMLVPQKMRRLF